MLRRIVALSQGVSGSSDTARPPVETLDGLGGLQRAPTSAQTIAAGAFADTVASPSRPPGFYGTPDARRALNLAGAVKRFAAIGELPAGVARESYARNDEGDFPPRPPRPALAPGPLYLLIAYPPRGRLPRLPRPPRSAPT